MLSSVTHVNFIFILNATDWSLQLRTTNAVNANNHLLFLCGNCMAVAHPVSLVSFEPKVTQLKAIVVNMATAINAQTTKLPPKLIDEYREAVAEQDAEALVILNDIKAILS